LSFWEEIYPVLSKDQPGLLGAITARAEAQAILIARRHQLQRWIGIEKAQRAGATFVGAMGVNLGVHAAVHDVSEDVGFKEVNRGVVILVSFHDELRQARDAPTRNPDQYRVGVERLTILVDNDTNGVGAI
jgi:hypothetical protein